MTYEQALEMVEESISSLMQETLDSLAIINKEDVSNDDIRSYIDIHFFNERTFGLDEEYYIPVRDGELKIKTTTVFSPYEIEEFLGIGDMADCEYLDFILERF